MFENWKTTAGGFVTAIAGAAVALMVLLGSAQVKPNPADPAAPGTVEVQPAELPGWLKGALLALGVGGVAGGASLVAASDAKGGAA